MKYVLLVSLIFLSFAARAAMPVEIVSTADDPVGSQLVYSVKEKIRQSSSLELSLDDPAVRMQAQIVTLERDPSNPGVATVYSVVLTWDNTEQPFPFYLTQYTGYCGSSSVNSCASTIVAKISETSDAVIRLLASKLKKR